MVKFSTEFGKLGEHCDINTLWDKFSQKCILLINAYVPSKLSSQRYNQVWVNSEIKNLSRRKHRAYKKAKHTGKKSDWDNFHQIQKETQRTCKDTYNNYVSNMLSEDHNNNPKKFWSFIKSKRCESTGVSALRHNGALYEDSATKADILNKQFSSVFSLETDNATPKTGHLHETVPEIVINPKGVYKLLQNINPHKATGPDNIPGNFLKQLAVEVTPVLTQIFTASITQGKVPDQWKEALITPIFKKGDRSTASNYRPVSLTCICCKLLEHILHTNIINHMEENNVLSKFQHGFRKMRSCESQLINTLQDLSDGINEGEQIDCILLDFSKAFDKVPHRRLLAKCDYYGIRGNILKWIASFLQGRSQKVLVDGETSQTADVTSGVPQGTVMGPLLFLLYINDLPEAVSSKARLFADDCLLYRKIHNQYDCETLQKDLDHLQQWEADWLMNFNPDKCEVLRITNKKSPIDSTYTVHGRPLAQVRTAKYLGLNINRDLTWSKHISAIAKKANSATAFLRRNINTCPKNIKMKCYTTLVRPIVEYASSVWDPVNKGDIHKIEMVQRRAARFVYGDNRTTSSVSSMLRDLEWATLEQRRKRTKVTTLYKTIHELIDIEKNRLQPSNTRQRTRGHQQRFVQPRSRVKCHEQSFFPSTIRLWNSLPPAVVYANTVDQFRDRLVRLAV